MFDCENLVHPFQHDPGVSQRQRIMEALLEGSAKIDGRTMADLLDYFVQLSRHVNYYDTEMRVSDWQPFFSKSTPFVLAAIIRFNQQAINGKFTSYKTAFDKRPSKAGVQLLSHYIFNQLINQINNWQLQLQGSELPAAAILDKLIRDKLSAPVEKFICSQHAAVKLYHVKPIDFVPILQNPVWNLQQDILTKDPTTCKPAGTTKRKRLTALRNQFMDLVPGFLDAIRILSTIAAQSMEKSLFPLKEELRQKHPPHLALLFSFLKLFRHLQDDLNGYTRKHLDYFYKKVLGITSRGAVPDKVHLVFEIQKQLDKYLLKKNLLVKDGKDANKADILYALDDEILVNKAQVTQQRTLFVNNIEAFGKNYIEGVYMAPDAGKADGLLLDFPDEGPKSFPTLGAHYSKFRDKGQQQFRPYPGARLGFILASPVLLLNEGQRTIDIILACELNENYCGSLVEAAFPKIFPADSFYGDIAAMLNKNYYYISDALIAEAIKQGISKQLEDKLRDLLAQEKKSCYRSEKISRYEIVVTDTEWLAFYMLADAGEKLILDQLFKPRKTLKISFSGKEEWIEPSNDAMNPLVISIDPVLPAGNFLLKIHAVLGADKPAIGFYDKDKLKEDFNTKLPLVKIELDDTIRIRLTNDELENRTGGSDQDRCCVAKNSSLPGHLVSPYHFFRNVQVIGQSAGEATRIDVSVCGVRNFVVQNDDGLQNVNAPVYPFGTRPDIIDFSVVNPTACITPQFILDAVAHGLTNPSKLYLQNLLKPENEFRVRVAKNSLESFLNIKDSANVEIFSLPDKNILRDRFNDPAKEYCIHNQKGPSFYIGSTEIFGKKWKSVRLNLNWKDKPGDFREYYNAYVLEDMDNQVFGLDETKFQLQAAVLQEGKWKEENFVRRLFDTVPPPALPPLTAGGTIPCSPDGTYAQGLVLKSTDFPGQANQPFHISPDKDTAMTVSTRSGFIRLMLQGQDFLHKDYGYVLARQMMALGKYPDQLLEGAVYRKDGTTVIKFKNLFGQIQLLQGSITNAQTQALIAKNRASIAYHNFATDANYTAPPVLPEPPAAMPATPTLNSPISNAERDSLFKDIYRAYSEANSTIGSVNNINSSYQFLRDIFSWFDPSGTKVIQPLEILIPNEPWTPIIQGLSIDYTARAEMVDIDLIHLYPYEGTYKQEAIELAPTLFPAVCYEGNLFIGISNLVPGNNLNLLFQLAEATADSESDPEEVHWHYLENNQWKELRKGFELLDDATEGLTTSGIVKLATPAGMSKENTIMPKGMHWIRASVPKNSPAVSETIGIHAQAIRATFTNDTANDKLRLATPLPALSVSRLNEADAYLKKVEQPYDSMDGSIPEEEGHYYIRLSESLRHKGRAIQKFDYERLALERFPKLFKAKCVNHSFALNAHKYKNDFPVAPGYVLLAVIPDLNKLKAAESFEPRVPASMLEDIQEQLRKLTSPFVRFRAMNPRYEKIHFCLKVKLVKGKDENYYTEKLKQDLREFLAPWAIGEYDKLSFGQCVDRSGIIRFLESRDYIDFIIELLMRHENDAWPLLNDEDHVVKIVCPKTPRSILVGGDIDVSIPEAECEQWGTCRDGQQREVDCCTNEKIPVADYCPDIVIT